MELFIIRPIEKAVNCKQSLTTIPSLLTGSVLPWLNLFRRYISNFLLSWYFTSTETIRLVRDGARVESG